MAKINTVHFDSTTFKRCSVALESALQGFDSAINAASGLDVPDFSYQGWLNTLPSLLESYKMQCKEDQTWADNANSLVEGALESSEGVVRSVDVQTGLVKELIVN
jgi:hypothetical protein